MWKDSISKYILNDVGDKEQYEAKFSNRFAALENLNEDADTSRAYVNMIIKRV
jgi:hypothetical protein